MCALAVIGATLINPSMAPLTKASGAQSESNPDSGIDQGPTFTPLKPITGADRAGAAILTILITILTVGGAVWIVWD